MSVAVQEIIVVPETVSLLTGAVHTTTGAIVSGVGAGVGVAVGTGVGVAVGVGVGVGFAPRCLVLAEYVNPVHSKIKTKTNTQTRFVE